MCAVRMTGERTGLVGLLWTRMVTRLVYACIYVCIRVTYRPSRAAVDSDGDQVGVFSICACNAWSIYQHTYVCAYMYVFVYVYLYVCMYVCMCTGINVRNVVRLCIHTLNACIRMCVHVYVCARTQTCVHAGT